jgi:hypothetical protein
MRPGSRDGGDSISSDALESKDLEDRDLYAYEHGWKFPAHELNLAGLTIPRTEHNKDLLIRKRHNGLIALVDLFVSFGMSVSTAGRRITSILASGKVDGVENEWFDDNVRAPTPPHC